MTSFQHTPTKKRRKDRETTQLVQSDAEVEFIRGQMKIDGTDFHPKVVPPKPTDILDISHQQLDQVLKLSMVSGGKEMIAGNIFFGCTAPSCKPRADKKFLPKA